MRVLGHEIHVVSNKQNHNETVVLIHGIGVSHAYFWPLMRAMTDNFNVIALDLPGYGKTDDPDKILDIDQLAAVVNEFVRRSDLKNITLVGHSMGTQIVVQAVIEQQSLYKKCILLAPTISRSERSLPQQAWRLLQDTLREPLKVNMIVFREYFRMGIVRYLKTTQSMISDAIEHDLKRVAIPTLIINGAHDPISDNQWAKELADSTQWAVLRDIPSAPHVFQYTHPEETMRLCAEFIRD